MDTIVTKLIRMPVSISEHVEAYRFDAHVGRKNDAYVAVLEAGLKALRCCEECRDRPKLRGYRVCAECWGDRPAADVLDAKRA